MSTLLVYDSTQRPFNVDELEAALRGSSRFVDVKRGPGGGWLVSARHVAHGHASVLYVHGKALSIGIEGVLQTNCSAAVELQRHWTGLLRVIDMPYTFDFLVGDNEEHLILQILSS